MRSGSGGAKPLLCVDASEESVRARRALEDAGVGFDVWDACAVPPLDWVPPFLIHGHRVCSGAEDIGQFAAGLGGERRSVCGLREGSYVHVSPLGGGARQVAVFSGAVAEVAELSPPAAAALATALAGRSAAGVQAAYGRVVWTQVPPHLGGWLAVGAAMGADRSGGLYPLVSLDRAGALALAAALGAGDPLAGARARTDGNLRGVFG